MTVTLYSYGCKWGTHPAGLTKGPFDLRKYPNPYHDKRLRALTGLDRAVQREVFSQGEVRRLVFLMKVEDGDVVGFYCTAGHHRSVAVVEVLSKILRRKGFEVEVVHRDLDRGRGSQGTRDSKTQGLSARIERR